MKAGRSPEGRESKISLGAACGAVVLLLWLLAGFLAIDATLVEPNRIVVEEVRVPLAGLPAELDGLRIAHVADLHLTDLGRREARAAALINGLEPDLIVVTGDLIRHTVLLDVQREWAGAAARWLNLLEPPPLGTWVTRGNVDVSRYGDFNTAFVEALQETDAHLLLNRAAPVNSGGMTLWIAGVDFSDFAGGFVSDFVVAPGAGGQWLAAGRSDGNSTAHLWDEAALEWRDYEFTGRLMREDERGGVGVTFYSRFPAGHDRYYRLRCYDQQPTLRIAPHGARISAGQTDTGVAPEPGRWYRFRIQVFGEGEATRVRARVWPADESEPAIWQADCVDDAPGRLTAGTVGLWGLGEGGKRFDDLLVRANDLGVSAGDVLLDENFDSLPAGRRPPGWAAFGVNAGNVELAVQGAPAGAPLILLAHSPDQALEAVGTGVDLVLSGHTHGGQVRLPLVGAVYTGTELGRRYAAGLHRLDGLWLYVTRGIGTTGLPIRFLCPPEVTLLTLEAGD